MSVKMFNEPTKKIIYDDFMRGYTQRELSQDYECSIDTIRRIIKEQRTVNESKISIEHEYTPIAAASKVKFVPTKQMVHKPEPIWNMSSKFISITIGRETFNATPATCAGFDRAKELLIQDKVQEALEIINVQVGVERYIKGDVRIEDGALYYKDIEIRSGLTERIINSMQEGEAFEFYLPFLENLMENPSRKAVSRLFDFLVANDITITDDGHFIAWKVVNSEYMDCRTGRFDNQPGTVVEMPRNQVDEDDNVTCSSGLHVCAKSYISIYRGSTDKIISVKVHPRDVVSIPVDYKDAKMRTCRYLSLADVSGIWS